MERRLLSLDGGGIRGVLTIEILAEIERKLRRREGTPDLVLADYFDYIGGTSTGAIIATCLSIGMEVDAIRQFYHSEAEHMFTHASLLRRLRYKYSEEPLAVRLREVLGPDTTLGSESLRTYLLLVLRNASTDSAWPLSNNPTAKFNDSAHPDCNLRIPLWQLIRASAAAPVFFPPEFVTLPSGTEYAFVDGGVTSYNNPAFLLYMMATTPAYRLNWDAREDSMLLVSIGTGRSEVLRPGLPRKGETIFGHAVTVPLALMSASAAQQDQLCRTFGRCLFGLPLDQELGTMMSVRNEGGPRKFTYARYDAELSTTFLESLGLGHVEPSTISQLDATSAVQELAAVGRAVGRTQVDDEHFAGFGLRPDPAGPNKSR